MYWRPLPHTRLPIRSESLVSLASLLIRIQPIFSTASVPRPISSLRSSSTYPTIAASAVWKQVSSSSASGSGALCRGHSKGCQHIASDGHKNQRIRNQYMCGNSLSSMATSCPAVIQSKGPHTATVIFLHGLGDQGYGWAESFEMIREPHIKYIFPHAGVMPVTVNMGMTMPSWFDIISLGVGGREDEAGIKKASESLMQLVCEEEQKGIPTNRIVIGGFSQGGAVALYTAITQNKQFAGLLGLSTWMPVHKKFKTEGVTKKALPVLQCHGTSDPLLPFTLGELTHKFLQTQVMEPEFRAFDGLVHSSSMEEMLCVRDFLKKVLL